VVGTLHLVANVLGNIRLEPREGDESNDLGEISCGREVAGTSSGSCQMANFVNSDVEFSGYVIIELLFSLFVG
jgi:hypothetical protein